jgi:hypothetical protein
MIIESTSTITKRARYFIIVKNRYRSTGAMEMQRKSDELASNMLLNLTLDRSLPALPLRSSPSSAG